MDGRDGFTAVGMRFISLHDELRYVYISYYNKKKTKPKNEAAALTQAGGPSEDRPCAPARASRPSPACAHSRSQKPHTIPFHLMLRS